MVALASRGGLPSSPCTRRARVRLSNATRGGRHRGAATSRGTTGLKGRPPGAYYGSAKGWARARVVGLFTALAAGLSPEANSPNMTTCKWRRPNFNAELF